MKQRCGSCNAEIFWARTEKGKMMPVDAEPVVTGNLEISGGVAYVIKPDSLLPKEERYVSH